MKINENVLLLFPLWINYEYMSGNFFENSQNDDIKFLSTLVSS